MRGTRQLCQERSPAFGQKTARNPGENKGPLKLIPLEAGGSEIHGNWRRDVRKEGWKHPQSIRIGWFDGEYLYLESNETMAIIQTLAKQQNHELSDAVRRRLAEKG